MGAILWWIIAALVVFWIVGLALDLVGGLIHIALVIAAVLFVVSMFTNRARI
ncbi:MAG: lmo0937 family membrane protein [Armatimonadota bacterium]